MKIIITDLTFFHGTQSEEFERPRYPFWMTNSKERAERFSLRSCGAERTGYRKLLVAKLIRCPNLLWFDSESAIEQATGQTFNDIDQTTRMQSQALALQEAGGWDGWFCPDCWGKGAHDLMILRPGLLDFQQTIYLEEDDDDLN
jgi:hypothetical protein